MGNYTVTIRQVLTSCIVRSFFFEEENQGFPPQYSSFPLRYKKRQMNWIFFYGLIVLESTFCSYVFILS